MSKNNWIDFKKLKRELNFELVLAHYKAYGDVRQTDGGRQQSGFCPLPSCKAKPPKKTFSANLDRGIWRCFSCRSSGNALDFVALMEGFDPSKKSEVRKAAEIAASTFPRDVTKEAVGEKVSSPISQSAEPPSQGCEKTLVNAPLDFELKSLDPTHPWFEERGLSRKTVEHFGLGYCGRGWLKGRIAIPIHSSSGKLLGYAGRIVNEARVSKIEPLYIFPQPRIRAGTRYEFDFLSIIYNIHRAKLNHNDLQIASSIDAVWRSWQDTKSDIAVPMATLRIQNIF